MLTECHGMARQIILVCFVKNIFLRYICCTILPLLILPVLHCAIIFFFFFYFSLFIYSGTHLRQSSWEQQECFFFNRALLGGSGGVVNSLDFCPASRKSLGCFYFRCILSSQWKAVTVNLRILHCQLYVSGNKQ